MAEFHEVGRDADRHFRGDFGGTLRRLREFLHLRISSKTNLQEKVFLDLDEDIVRR